MKPCEQTPFGEVRQIGLLTGDLDAFIKSFRALYGLEPDRLALVPVNSTQENCERRVAYYNYPEIEIEVIEPLRSKREWHEFLERHGDSVHHLQFNVADFDGACNRILKNGCRMIERGFSIRVPEVRYIFFDTVDLLGYVTEIVNFKEIEMPGK